MPDKEKEVGLPKIDYAALSRQVHGQGTLAEQYGGARGEQRGTALTTQRFNEAFDEYSKENPNTDKDSFRKNIYTYKAKDEENLTPWQQRKRKDLEEAAGLAAEDQEAFRAQQTENFAGLSDQAKGSRAGHALRGIRELGGALPSDIKRLVGKYGAKGGGAVSPGTLKDEDFSKIQKYLESRQGTSSGEGANKILQGLYKQSPVQRSPLKRMSPFKQLSNNPYAYQNYTSLQGAADTVEQLQADKRASEERARNQELQRLQLGEIKAKQQEAFIVPADTGFNEVDLAINQASRGLVDQAGALTAQLKKGDIDTDEYATKLAKIRSQVPAVKQFKDTLTGNLNNYLEASKNGQISEAMDPKARAFYLALSSPEQDSTLGVDEEGNVTFTGTFVDPTDPEGLPQPFSYPASGIGQMPKPVLKQPGPTETLKKPMAELSKRLNAWDDVESADFAKQQLDAVIEQGGDGALKSLALDHFKDEKEFRGKTSAEITALADEPAPEGSDASNLLEHMVEQSWVGTAKSMFVTDKLAQEKEQLANAINQQRLDALEKGVNNPSGGLTPNQQAVQQQRQAISNFIGKTLQTALPEGGEVDVAALNALQDAKIQEIKHIPAGKNSTSSWYNPLSWGDEEDTPEEFEIWVKGEKQPRIVGRNQLSSVIGQIKLGTNTPNL